MSVIVHVFDKNWRIWYAANPYAPAGVNTKPKDLKTWAKEQSADLVYNFAFFNLYTTANIKNGVAGHTIQNLHAQGKDCGYGCGTDEILRINNDNYCNGWKLGAINGVAIAKDTASKRARNFHGMTADGRYIVAQSDKMTEKDVAAYVVSYVKEHYSTTVQLLLVMDGGGSVGCYSARTKQLYAPEKEGTNGRAVSSVLCAQYIGPDPTRTLKQGCEGEDVRVFQMLATSTEADGKFGPGTKKQAKKVQYSLALIADGSIGPASQSIIYD